MDFKRFCFSNLFTLLALLASVCANNPVEAQIRVKKPDRGSYQAPVVQRGSTANAPFAQASMAAQTNSVQPASYQQSDAAQSGSLQAIRDSQIVFKPVPKRNSKAQTASRQQQTNTVRATGGEIISSGEIIHQGIVNEGVVIHDSIPIDAGVMASESCGCPDCVGAVGCDVGGCDSMGCNMCSGPCGLASPSRNAFISLNRCDWFGSVELMLMFRRGDRPPALVTTGPDDNVDTAGELTQDDTSILVGGDSIFKDHTAGMRLQLGTWLDSQQSRSLVMRGWFAGEKTFGFTRNQDTLGVIARPFFNVSDGQTAEQDTQVIAFPDRASGELTISGDSNVFGGDLSIRQLMWGEGQFAVDVFYGYQFMRLDENLSINTTSLSLSDDFAPLGSVLSVSDSFDIENEFHGGQLGLSSLGRWGCWSFSGLAKVGFGSLRRSADLRGQTTTSNGGVTAVDANGLLVRSTNSGKRSDSTFGWTPEFDLTLGWRKFPHFDATVGYHVIGMTDALQVSGAIDPDLAVNLAAPPTGQLRPSSNFRYDTFYVQGIHFGLSYVY